jgi:hypothetical protein
MRSPRDPWIRHDLHLDDRLTLAAVADLADRLPRRSVIADTAAQPLLFLKVVRLGVPWHDRATLYAICTNANAWLTLLMVEDRSGMAKS